jgi:lycopene cyclase domain-containing protein
LNQKFLYLAIDLFSVLVPFIATFYPKAPFYKKWKYVWIAILIPGLFFLIWDEYFTRIGIWGFNEKYLTGITLGHLPLEEVLFFVCIPYACLFTYFALRYLIQKDYFQPYQKLISTILTIALVVACISFIGKAYTGTTFLFLAIFISFEQYYRKVTYLSRFYLTYLVILIPFFIVNGILTGSFIEGEVVWYNNQHNLGIRMGTIPLEDTFYGMLLLMMNVSLYDRLSAGDNPDRSNGNRFD